MSLTSSYSTANNLNQYPEVGSSVYSFNENGCLTGDGTWTHAYDTESHLLSSTRSGISLTFDYDPFDRQAQKTVTTSGTIATNYIYSGWQRIADYDGSDVLQNRYIYGTGLDEPLIQVSSAGVLTFLCANHQGSIIAISDSTGVVANKISYGPFGETSSLDGTTFGFTGQRYDPETGLYYYKWRYYSPVIGRFLLSRPV